MGGNVGSGLGTWEIWVGMRGVMVGMRGMEWKYGECGEWCEDTGNQGGNDGNQGGNDGNARNQGENAEN